VSEATRETVFDFPIWGDFPYKVPFGLEVRRGFSEVFPKQEIITFYHPIQDWHFNTNPEVLKSNWGTIRGILKRNFYAYKEKQV
jgi:hypothetical protein